MLTMNVNPDLAANHAAPKPAADRVRLPEASVDQPLEAPTLPSEDDATSRRFYAVAMASFFSSFARDRPSGDLKNS